MKCKYDDIKPDTSLYQMEPERSIALAKVAQAQERGEIIQTRFKSDGARWSHGGTCWALDTTALDYRVKPAPVVEVRTEWAVRTPYVPARPYQNRAEAWRHAAVFSGPVSIERHTVEFVDGVEKSREVQRA